MSALENRIPPPIVGLACGGAMAWLAGLMPALMVPAAARYGVAIAALALGLGVMLAGVLSFRRARTTVNPLKPDSASALVTGGVYRYTRNPMYLGMLALLVGWAAYLASIPAAVGPVAFWLFIDRFQIRPEERALQKIFGEAFVEYCARVRRWS